MQTFVDRSCCRTIHLNVSHIVSCRLAVDLSSRVRRKQWKCIWNPLCVMFSVFCSIPNSQVVVHPTLFVQLSSIPHTIENRSLALNRFSIYHVHNFMLRCVNLLGNSNSFARKEHNTEPQSSNSSSFIKIKTFPPPLPPTSLLYSVFSANLSTCSFSRSASNEWCYSPTFPFRLLGSHWSGAKRKSMKIECGAKSNYRRETVTTKSNRYSAACSVFLMFSIVIFFFN